MASELTILYPTTGTIYAILRNRADDTVASIVAGAWATWADGSIADYDVTMTSKGGDVWSGDLPAWITAGTSYRAVFYLQAGVGPAVGDLILGHTDAIVPQSAAGIAAVGTLYATVASLKAMLGISGSAKDTKLTNILDDVSRSIDNDCGQYFYIETATTYYFNGAGGTELFLMRPLISVTTFAVDTEADGTFDGETWTEVTDFVLKPINSSPKWAVWTPPWGRYALPSQVYAIKITGSWGWAAVPRLISQECLVRAKADYEHYDEREEFQLEGMADARYQRWAPEVVRKAELMRVSFYRERRFR